MVQWFHSLAYYIRHFAPWLRKWDSCEPVVVYALRRWLTVHGWCRIVVAVNSHGHAWTFSEQVMTSIIDDSRCGMSEVAFHTAPPVSCKVRQLYISRTAWPTSTKFYRDVQTDLLYIHTRYDVIKYFRFEVILKKLSKMLPLTASDGISLERLSEDRVILQAYRGLSAPQTCWI